MDEEMHSLKENDTFILTPLPVGKQTVGGRWVYAVKESADGTLTHKNQSSDILQHSQNRLTGDRWLKF